MAPAPLFGLAWPSYDMATPRGVASLAVAMIVVGGCMYVAARLVAKQKSLHQALAAGAFGLLAAQLVWTLTDEVGIVAFLLSLAAFAAVAAAFYRKKFAEGVALGAVAWVMWIVANVVLGYVQAHWK